MKFKHLSLRIRIFLAMILLILLASILIATVTIYQYKEQTEEYNQGRLDRKEEAVKASINYWFDTGNTFRLSLKTYLIFLKIKFLKFQILKI